MAGILVVTQGALADELARGARTIAGSSTPIATVSLGWDESPAQSEGKVAAALAALDGSAAGKNGVLILTDLPGATPFNIAKRFARPGRIEVLSGVNLSMVVRVCCPGCEDLAVGELAGWLAEKGRQSISHYQPGAETETGKSGG